MLKVAGMWCGCAVHYTFTILMWMCDRGFDSELKLYFIDMDPVMSNTQ